MATLTPASNASIDTPANLALVDLSLIPPGQYEAVRVGFTGLWHYRADSTANADGVGVVAALNAPGRWVRDSIGVPGANKITAWFVNTTTGSDAAAGTSVSTPLASAAEVFRRIGKEKVPQNVTVTVVGNDTTLDIDVYLHPGVTFTIQGTRTVAVADVLSARTVWAASTSTLGQYTFTTTTGALTAYVGAAMVQVHATPTQVSPVIKDLTSGAFRGLFGDTASAGAQVEPGATAAVDIYTTNAFTGNVTVHVRGPGYVQFNDLNLATTSASVRVTEGGAIFQGCLVHALTVLRPAQDVQTIASQVFDGTVYGRVKSSSTTWTFGATTALTIAGGAGIVQALTISMCQGGSLSVGSGTEGAGKLIATQAFAVADYGAANAVQVWHGSGIRALDYFFITRGTPASTAGYVVNCGGFINYASGKLIATGGTAPTTFSTVASTAKASGALPYVEPTLGFAAITVDA